MYRNCLTLIMLSFIVATNLNSQSVGFDYSGMDKSVKPGDDFNLFVNGKWLKETDIPSDQSRWGSFILLREENNKRLRMIMEEASSKKFFRQ
jgi:putative endopeptidase